MRWLALALVPALLGCALTTTGPGGPMLTGTTTQMQLSSAAAYGPARATVGDVRVSGNGQTETLALDNLSPNPMPITVGVRQQIGTSFEVNADVGWLDSGFGARIRLPSREHLPLVLSAGARSGEVALFRRPTYHGVVAVEGYPVLSAYPGGLHVLRLVLSVGLVAGGFEHDLRMPDKFQLEIGDAPGGSANAIVIRRELRFQSAVGIHLQGPNGGFTVALQPWIVLAHSASFSATCDSCLGRPPITAFSQTWGASLLFIPAFHLSAAH
jgi:hypothetical protein